MTNNTTIHTPRDASSDQEWWDMAAQWQIRPDTIYLNHGSFSPQVHRVRHARRGWIDRLDEQPMDFYLRQLEPALNDARITTADFFGTRKENLVFVDNSTYGMNVVAESIKLRAGDEVLMNNHEYGAVIRIWQRQCDRAGATLKIMTLPDQFESEQQIIDTLTSGVSDKTKLAIVSHITSATALVMPIKDICQAFADRGVAVCVDGPHAPVQVEFAIDDLNCDFYTASCHKWLCSTLGSGFLYAHPRQHANMQPAIKSWGRLLPAMPETWDEEFTWIGSRDPSPFLTIPVAIDWLREIGFENFRQRSRWLAAYAEDQLGRLFGTKPIGDRSQGWYASMAHVPMPPGDWSGLQKQLWEQVGIEVMIIQFESRWYIRVSCHLYNNQTQIDTLIKALARLTAPN